MTTFLLLIQKTQKTLKTAFAACSSLHELIVCKNKLIGRSAPLIIEFNRLLSAMKKTVSKPFQLFKIEVEKLYQEHARKIHDQIITPQINNNFQQLHKSSGQFYYQFLTRQTPHLNLILGQQHLLTKTINDIHYFCAKMHWKFVPSADLVTFAENFQLLNIATDHPAMGSNDSFIVQPHKDNNSTVNTKTVNEKWVLRTHCTSMTARELRSYAKDKKPRSIYTIGNVYRNDTDDSTHLKQFSQLDVCLIGVQLSLANLKWILVQFCHFLFGTNHPLRFRNAFFPFTEPSLELDVGCCLCQQKGCSVCYQTGWVELLGAGIISLPVLQKCNIADNVVALAFGVGIERIVMMREKIADIRSLYRNNSLSS